MTEVEALQQEVKTLTLRVWEFEKRLREIEEQNREIGRTGEFLRSVLGYEREEDAELNAICDERKDMEEFETDIERIAAKYSDELERLKDR